MATRLKYIARSTCKPDQPRRAQSLSSAESRYVDNERCHTHLVNGTVELVMAHVPRLPSS